MAESVGVDVVNLMHEMTVTVNLQRVNELRWRLVLGKWLIGLAARVLNCGIVFERRE